MPRLAGCCFLIFPPLGETFPSFGVVRLGRVTCTFRNMRYLCTAFYAPRGMRPRGGVEWNGLSRGVMVAQQVLVLFVKVRILARQHKEKNTIFAPSKRQTNIGVVVQLVRIPACHAGGRGFESRPYRNEKRDNIRIIPFSVSNTSHIK